MEVYEWSPCNVSGGIFRWKRSSGISVHQYISPNSADLTQFTASRVLLFKMKFPTIQAISYLGSYQRAVTTVQKNMTESDLEEAQKIVNLWNVQGAPSDVKLK